MYEQQGAGQGGEKKGMPVIAWVGIGCGTVLILIVVVFSLLVGRCKRWAENVQKNPEKAAAEMVVKFNPDLDLVSQDEGAGRMTIRNNKTGEEVTLGYADVAEGRITVKDAEGGVTEIGAGAEQAPEWVPRLPDAVSSVNVFRNETATEISGVMSINTNSPADKAAEFFEQAAKDAGLDSSNTSSMSVGGTETRTMEFSGGGKTLNVQITAPGGGGLLMVQVAYTEKK